MKNLMRNACIALATLVSVAVVTPVVAADYDCPNRVVTIINDSDYVIETIKLRGRDSTRWSGNYLSEFDLYPGETVEIDGDYAPGSGAGYHIFYISAQSYEGPSWSDSFDMCTVSTYTLWN